MLYIERKMRLAVSNILYLPDWDNQTERKVIIVQPDLLMRFSQNEYKRRGK